MRVPRTQSGVAIVEFALVLPLLLVLSLIVTEFGRALYEYNTLVKSARDAARYLSMQDPTIATSEPARLLVARNLAVYGLPAPGGSDTPLLPRLSLANVPAAGIQWQTAGAAPLINTVRITISGYRFVPLVTDAFGIQLGDANGGIPFNAITAVMRAPS